MELSIKWKKSNEVISIDEDKLDIDWNGHEDLLTGETCDIFHFDYEDVEHDCIVKPNEQSDFVFQVVCALDKYYKNLYEPD